MFLSYDKNYEKLMIKLLEKREPTSPFNIIQITMSSDILCSAIDSHNDTVPYLDSELEDNPKTCICTLAAKAGDLTLLIRAMSNGFTVHAETHYQAAKAGQLPILMHLNQTGVKFNDDVAYAAAKYNRFLILDWLHTLGYKFKTNVAVVAAAKGNELILELLLKHGYGYDDEIGYMFDDAVAYAAAKKGHLWILRWLLTLGYNPTAATIYPAAKYGKQDVLVWANEVGCIFDESTAMAAVIGGQCEILVWLGSIGCSWDYQLCLKKAISLGKSDMIECVASEGLLTLQAVLDVSEGWVDIELEAGTPITPDGIQLNQSLYYRIIGDCGFRLNGRCWATNGIQDSRQQHVIIPAGTNIIMGETEGTLGADLESSYFKVKICTKVRVKRATNCLVIEPGTRVKMNWWDSVELIRQ